MKTNKISPAFPNIGEEALSPELATGKLKMETSFGNINKSKYEVSMAELPPPSSAKLSKGLPTSEQGFNPLHNQTLKEYQTNANISSFNDKIIEGEETKAEINMSENLSKSMTFTSREKTLSLSEKSTATRMKKQELLYDRTYNYKKLNSSKSIKMQDYFSRTKIELTKLKNIEDYPLDWRVNNDYKEDPELKALILHLDNKLRSFYPLHKDFAHTTVLRSYFMMVDLIRQIFFSVSVICFYNEPFTGMIFVVLINVMYLIGFIIVKPFKLKLDIGQNILNELLLLIICCCTLMMAYMEKFNDFNEDLKMKMGWTIVFSNVSLIVIFLSRMMINLFNLAFFLIKLIVKVIISKLKKRNQVGDENSENEKGRRKSKEGDLLQKIIEIENFLR